MSTATQGAQETAQQGGVGDGPTARVVLEIDNVTKRFGATQALKGVSFRVHAGEILALVGANGAGKSTLMSIVSGSLTPTSGSLRVNGKEAVLGSVKDASASGIETITQNVDDALVPDATVWENLVFPQIADNRFGAFPSVKAMRAEAERIAAGRLAIDLNETVRHLSTSDKQQVLIARALASKPVVLILDEPTAALGIQESERLHADVRRLAQQGTAIIFISHHMGEVAELCDSAVVLRDGAEVATFTKPLDTTAIVRAMLGDLADGLQHDGERGETARNHAHTSGRTVLSLKGVRSFRDTRANDIDIHEGEVVGLTGLVGAGKTELISQIVGDRPLISGTMTLDGKPYDPHHPSDAIRAGVGYVPEDRAVQGEIPDWSIRENLSLPDLKRYRHRYGLLSFSREESAARHVIKTLGIVGASTAPIKSLSGGNRQKVIVGRWVSAQSKVLIFDEPFRGVDIGAREDIARLLRKTGTALVASSDPEEILQVADRILVMSNGVITGEVDPASTTADELSQLIADEAGISARRETNENADEAGKSAVASDEELDRELDKEPVA